MKYAKWVLWIIRKIIASIVIGVATTLVLLLSTKKEMQEIYKTLDNEISKILNGGNNGK